MTICMTFFHSVEKLYVVCDSFVCGVVCINGVASIMIRCQADVPTFISARLPTSSYFRFILDDDFFARRR